MLGWYKQVDDQYLSFWLQVSWHGWDPYAGSEFTVELQLAEEPVLGIGVPESRARLFDLLKDSQLEQARRLQNRVLAKLKLPPSDYSVLQLDAHTSEWYLERFKPVTEPYTQRSDTWLRYHDEEDVRLWAQFLLEALPEAIKNLAPLVASRQRQDETTEGKERGNQMELEFVSALLDSLAEGPAQEVSLYVTFRVMSEQHIGEERELYFTAMRQGDGFLWRAEEYDIAGPDIRRVPIGKWTSRSKVYLTVEAAIAAAVEAAAGGESVEWWVT